MSVSNPNEIKSDNHGRKLINNWILSPQSAMTVIFRKCIMVSQIIDTIDNNICGYLSSCLAVCLSVFMATNFSAVCTEADT